MNTLLLVLLILLLMGGGGYGWNAGWYGNGGVSLVGLIVIVLIVYLVVGR